MCSIRLLSRIFPNAFVLTIALVILLPNYIWFYPILISESSNPIFIIIDSILTFFFFVMWAWCWLYTGIADPGSVKKDLEARGLLKRIQQGDIPECLRRLEICNVCNLPMPYSSCHCKECGECYLRQDHHCGVTGQCIADKNFKSFVLSFLYGGITCLLILPTAIMMIKNNDFFLGAMVMIIYSGLFGFILLSSFVSFSYNSMKNISTIDKINGRTKKVGLKKLFMTFGNTWFEKLIPIQKNTTDYAWPGTIWENDESSL